MNKAILIFGSNSVIVRDFIRLSLKNGVNVVGISKTKNKFFLKSEKFHFIKHNILKNDNNNLLKKINKNFDINSIIYAIGGSLNKKNILESKKNWKLVWEYNFGYTIELNNYFLKKFKKDKFGRILYFSSTITNNKNGPVAYSASKKMIEDYVVKMGNNFAESNIYINALLTSIVSGKGNNWGKFEAKNYTLKKKQVVKKMLSSQKFGRSEYFTKLIALLVTKDNSFITGSIIRADGGYKL